MKTILLLLLTVSALPTLAQQPVYLPYTAQQAAAEKKLFADPIWQSPYQPVLSEDAKLANSNSLSSKTEPRQ